MYKNSRQNAPQEIKRQGPDIHELLEGSVFTSDTGSFFLIEKKYPAGYTHGGCDFGCIPGRDISALQKACGEASRPVKTADLLFLDTETTGLSGGTGTVAFLIGVGFFSEGHFVLRQYFMRDYNEEYAMLKALNETLQARRGLVTFNGKAYDWNLLQTRFTFNRLRAALSNPVHMDLLYPSRTLWKLKLESCRLSSIEQNILNESRSDDIPGSVIPTAYFKYLDDRNATEIKRVIDHNEKDILSLVALLSRIDTLLRAPLEEAGDKSELFGAGNMLEKSCDLENAMECYSRCSDSESRTIREKSLWKLAGIHKKSKNYAAAAEQLEIMLDSSQAPNIQVMIELAKHYEHRVRDIHKAMSVVQEALDACAELSFVRNLYYRELTARMDRLKRKAARL